MQTTAIISERLPKVNEAKPKTKVSRRSINGNYLILAAIVIFCCILLFLNFPFWAVFTFGVGMSFILFLLYLLRGIQIVLDLNQKEVEEAIKQDLFY
jgi:hypothetical protein